MSRLRRGGALRADARSWALKSPPCGIKEVGKGLARNTPDEWIDEPGEDRGHIATKRNGLHLHVNSAVLFFQPPVVVHTPKIAVPLANGKLRAVGLVGRRQLGDSRRDCTAGHMRSIDPGVVNFEFSIEGNAPWGVLVELQIDFEGVVRAFQKLRAANVRFIGAPVVVVILQQGQGAFQGNSGLSGCSGCSSSAIRAETAWLITRVESILV